MFLYAYIIFATLLIIGFIILIYKNVRLPTHYVFIENTIKETDVIEVRGSTGQITSTRVQPSKDILFYENPNFDGNAIIPDEYDVYQLAETDRSGNITYNIKSINAPLNSTLVVYAFAKDKGVDIGSYKYILPYVRPIKNMENYFRSYPQLSNNVTGLRLSYPSVIVGIMVVPSVDEAKKLVDESKALCLQRNSNHPDLCS